MERAPPRPYTLSRRPFPVSRNFSPALSDRSARHDSALSRVQILIQPESGPSQSRPVHACDRIRRVTARESPRPGRPRSWARCNPRMGRRGPSRVRPGQVADAMRVRAGVAPRVASGDRAASKGKPAGGCSSFKRRVEQEHRCAAPHARSDRPWCVCACAQVGWAGNMGWKVG